MKMGTKSSMDRNCNICSAIKDSDDDDSDDECWICYRAKKVVKQDPSLADAHKEIRKLRNELKSAKDHSNLEIQRLFDSLAAVRLELSDLKSLKADSENTTTAIESITEDVESIKENGTRLNDSNIRFIKKIAKKIAIREIVEWESD